jgi:hypothetical protein
MLLSLFPRLTKVPDMLDTAPATARKLELTEKMRGGFSVSINSRRLDIDFY